MDMCRHITIPIYKFIIVYNNYFIMLLFYNIITR